MGEATYQLVQDVFDQQQVTRLGGFNQLKNIFVNLIEVIIVTNFGMNTFLFVWSHLNIYERWNKTVLGYFEIKECSRWHVFLLVQAGYLDPPKVSNFIPYNIPYVLLV